MGWIVDWSGFIGAWLLVAGPLLQGSNELHKAGLQAHARDGRLPNLWWWLLPPVMYVISLQGLRDEAPETRDFRRIATGWYLVATGGLLIAVKESASLGSEEGWSSATTVTAFAIAAVVVWLATSARMITQTFQDRC